MKNALTRYFVAVLASSRRVPDIGLQVLTWCGVLVLFGHGQVGVSRSRRIASVALGVVLLMLAQLMNAGRRVAGRYDTLG